MGLTEYEPGLLKWVPANEPLHVDMNTQWVVWVPDSICKCCFIKDVLGQVGLVACAVGGTAIEEWARESHPYENMIKRSKAAEESGTYIISIYNLQFNSHALNLHYSKFTVPCITLNLETTQLIWALSG